MRSATYTTDDITRATGLNRMVVDAWFSRGVVQRTTTPRRGSPRKFSFVDIMQFRAIVELTRLGMSVAVAGSIAAEIEEEPKGNGPAVIATVNNAGKVTHYSVDPIYWCLVPPVTPSPALIILDLWALAERTRAALEEPSANNPTTNG